MQTSSVDKWEWEIRHVDCGSPACCQGFTAIYEEGWYIASAMDPVGSNPEKNLTTVKRRFCLKLRQELLV